MSPEQGNATLVHSTYECTLLGRIRPRLNPCMSDKMPPYDSFESGNMFGDVTIKCERNQDEQQLNYYDEYMNDDLWSDRKILLDLGNAHMLDASQEVMGKGSGQDSVVSGKVQQDNFETNPCVPKKRVNKNSAKQRKNRRKQTNRSLVQDCSYDSTHRFNRGLTEAEPSDIRANSNFGCPNKNLKLRGKAKRNKLMCDRNKLSELQNILSNENSSSEAYSGNEQKTPSETPVVPSDVCGKDFQTPTETTLPKSPQKFNAVRKCFRQTSKSAKMRTNKSAFPCELCGDVFLSKAAYCKHYLVHTGKNFFVCTICYVNFATRSSLQRHAHRSHAPDLLISLYNKPFSCDECGAQFSCSASVDRHSLVHTGERLYKCSRCDAAFMQSSTLKRHLASHTGVKPHKCTKCHVAFTRKSSLDRHVLAHDGDRPFVCVNCGEARARKDALAEHIKSCHRSKS